MYRKGKDKLGTIIRVADQLFYERGYDHTSFKDISEAVDIPRGNFYHYFKTKDEILVAVIEHRIKAIKEMLKQWEREIPEPLDRLKRYVQVMRNSQNEALRFGCPMGSLNTELGKDHLELREQSRRMFDVFYEWLKQQFILLGKKKQAGALARRLLAYTQGIVVIAHAYGDRKFLNDEAKVLDEWLNTLVE